MEALEVIAEALEVITEALEVTPLVEIRQSSFKAEGVVWEEDMEVEVVLVLELDCCWDLHLELGLVSNSFKWELYLLGLFISVSQVPLLR